MKKSSCDKAFPARKLMVHIPTSFTNPSLIPQAGKAHDWSWTKEDQRHSPQQPEVKPIKRVKFLTSSQSWYGKLHWDTLLEQEDVVFLPSHTSPPGAKHCTCEAKQMKLSPQNRWRVWGSLACCLSQLQLTWTVYYSIQFFNKLQNCCDCKRSIEPFELTRRYLGGLRTAPSRDITVFFSWRQYTHSQNAYFPHMERTTIDSILSAPRLKEK